MPASSRRTWLRRPRGNAIGECCRTCSARCLPLARPRSTTWRCFSECGAFRTDSVCMFGRKDDRTMPLLTVGIPVYNALPYLRESVESILNQTYENFELLIIDDGSTDDSLEYLKSIRDRRLRLIHQENRGLTATLNRMLAEANSP